MPDNPLNHSVARTHVVAIVATALGLLRYALIFVTHFLPVIQLEQ
jgi:hypothetical protein